MDWERLERLRERFLEPRAAGSYWRDGKDLEAYDDTFAQRIAWKWEAVVGELKRRGFVPPPGPVCDWGCGSGVASRVWLRAFPASELHLHDRDGAAVEFAERRARGIFPELRVARGIPEAPALLLASHVLTELERTAPLVGLARRSGAFVFVEPGAPEPSRALSAIRDSLAPEFAVVGPCGHSGPCGALLGATDWCHFFARPPPEIFHDRDWVLFGKRMGIDLRSLPYSWLAMRRGLGGPEPAVVALGRPRIGKAIARVTECHVSGLRERVVRRRDEPDEWARLARLR